MNHSYNRDMKYSFVKRCNKLIHSGLIDDEWMKEKNIEMEIIIPFKNLENLDEEGGKNSELKGWNDSGFDDLIGKNLHNSDINFSFNITDKILNSLKPCGENN